MLINLINLVLFKKKQFVNFFKCLERNRFRLKKMAVTLHTTHGEIKIEIFCEKTPIAAKNFLGLCARGDYNGTIFHRNISGFIIQGGD